jgi:hypothetical protein
VHIESPFTGILLERVNTVDGGNSDNETLASILSEIDFVFSLYL